MLGFPARLPENISCQPTAQILTQNVVQAKI
jgi:hypothetical protein